MRKEVPRSPRFLVHIFLVTITPWLLGTRCLDQAVIDEYQTAVSGGDDGGTAPAPTSTATDTSTGTQTGTECEEPAEFGEAESVEEMANYACCPSFPQSCSTFRRCSSKLVVNYWNSIAGWNSNDTERTVTVTGSGDTLSYGITDKQDAAAELTFELGKPVSLTILNEEGGDTHFITAPKFFRTVAWRRIDTPDGQFTATTFDAVGAKAGAGSIKLSFVPMVAGTYTIFSETGVTDGENYGALIDGSFDQANLNTGNAGKGLVATITVIESEVLGESTLFQETLLERDTALDSDARRYSTDPLWDSPNTFYELEDVGQVGSGPILLQDSDSGYAFEPASITLEKDTAYTLAFKNTGDPTHVYTAPSFFAASIMRDAQDDHAVVKAPYLTSVWLKGGESNTTKVTLAPITLLGTLKTYCEAGVEHLEGQPVLSTGHAGSGMIGTVTIEEAAP